MIEKNKKFDNATEYIKTFLCYGNTELSKRIVYLSDSEVKSFIEENTGKVAVVQSGFFDETVYGTNRSLECIPLLAGENLDRIEYEAKSDNYIIYTDVIAIAYALLTRYEEFLDTEKRDIYGNYPASEMTLVRQNLLEVPIIDVYSKQIVSFFNDLDKTEYSISKGINSISFTHDIDIPFERYSFLNMCKSIAKPLLKKGYFSLTPFLNWIGIYAINPRATWGYMLERENTIREKTNISTESICFIVALQFPDENTMAYIDDPKIKKCISEMQHEGSDIGLHTSYKGAESFDQIKTEKNNLEQLLKKEIKKQRNHFLRQIHPCDIEKYEIAGFTDDYTTGFNEVPGFRLGTTRVANWINPATGKVHDIKLHGLHIMDGSLSGPKPYQLELNYEEAVAKCKNIIDQVYRYNGDLCVLWHNGMFNKIWGNYQKKLYDWVIDYCMEITGDK